MDDSEPPSIFLIVKFRSKFFSRLKLNEKFELNSPVVPLSPCLVGFAMTIEKLLGPILVKFSLVLTPFQSEDVCWINRFNVPVISELRYIPNLAGLSFIT